jgi:hypothetical protein
VFSFQLATEGIESAVYKKLIAPFKNDLPTSNMDGLRRVCADHNYAYVSPNILFTNFSLSLPCQLVPLPGTYYKDPSAFIISKNSPYKGLINWRWENIWSQLDKWQAIHKFMISLQVHQDKTFLSVISLKGFNYRNVRKVCNIFFRIVTCCCMSL